MISTKTFINASKDGFTEITPELAREWLMRNKRNRTLNRDFVDKLKKTIVEGGWQPNTADHIAFYEDSTLANGQHRLTAIMESGVTVRSKIDYDIPKSASICIDSGRKRSFSDNVRIMLGETYYTPQISNAMRRSFDKGSRLTHENHLYIAKKYKDDIIFVSSLYADLKRALKRTEVISATFLALVSGVSREDLSKFAYVYRTGQHLDDSRYNYEAVIRYRDFLMVNSTNASYRHDISPSIRSAEYIIDAFVNNKSGRNFKSVDTFAYPLIKFDDIQHE